MLARAHKNDWAPYSIIFAIPLIWTAEGFVMLCVPWILPKAEIVLEDAALFVNNMHASTCGVDHDLERSKEKVGVFRIRHGDEMWKVRAAAVDRPVRLANIIEQPASRAYHKMIEIIRTCAIKAPRSSLHLCEAPGGFAQAVMSEFPKTTSIYVTSLQTNGAPHFASAVLRADPIVHIDLPLGSNLCHKEVRDELSARLRDIELITADGAIDNDAQPQLTESASAILIACEIDAAVRMQRHGGTFVLKVFAFTRPITKQLVAYLTTCYQTVSILKPFTSRAVNDERYIVCEGFLGAPLHHLLPIPAQPPPATQVLEKIGTVSDTWLKDAEDMSHHLLVEQRNAIEEAVKHTSSSARMPSSSLGGAPRGQSQRRGRPPYSRGNGRGRGRQSHRTS